MSWKIMYGASYCKAPSGDSSLGGEFATEAEATAAMERRADYFGNSRSSYKVVPSVPPAPPAQAAILTTDKAARKEMPIARGVVDYFPLALAEVAHVSFVANEQHNPGQEMHWDKTKSTDHSDCIARHLIERGGIDDDGLRHSAKLAWRALALLQTELEAAQAKK